MANTDRFNKQILLKEIGHKGQEKITNSSVLIVGLGGIGSPLVRYLASSGVGNLCLIDDDIIELDNLPRQNNYKVSDIDSAKADVTAKLLKELNPEIKLKIINKRANQKLLEALIVDYDLVIDASDNFQTKFLLGDICYRQGKNYISGSFLGFKGYVAVYKSGIDDSLPCFRCFHPDDLDASTEKACYKQGVFSPGVGVVGTYMAAEALKEIAKIAQSSAGKMMIFDFLTNNHHMVKISRKTQCFCTK